MPWPPRWLGKFKLSLWGEHAASDHKALLEGDKRINPKAPAASWILRKPALEIKHKGQQRFATEPPECSLLLRWIEQGATNDHETAAELKSLVVTPEDLTATSFSELIPRP
ncbi:MAG: hypothetical protein VX633_13235 [Verrucomicrobiota bacterium]|nr:hypothetical protein [Verrucomicrobiota bacterium]